MASQKQIDANRNNAKRSTGPRSLAGKARSRLNALRDGLTGQITTLSGKDRPTFEQHLAEMHAGFNPGTPIERKLANAVAWDTWRLDRLRAVEMNVFALGQEESREEWEQGQGGETQAHGGETQDQEGEAQDEETNDGTNPNEPDDLDVAFADARTFRDEAARLELLSLYESRMTRNIHRNMELLRSLQSERKRNYEQDKKEEVLIGRICEFNDMPVKASTTPSKNGFIFSNEEIAQGVVRHRYLHTAAFHLEHTQANCLHGGLILGAGDSFMRRTADNRPLSTEERREIENIPPEIRALDRLNNPEDYGIRQSPNQK